MTRTSRRTIITTAKDSEKSATGELSGCQNENFGEAVRKSAAWTGKQKALCWVRTSCRLKINSLSLKTCNQRGQKQNFVLAPQTNDAQDRFPGSYFRPRPCDFHIGTFEKSRSLFSIFTFLERNFLLETALFFLQTASIAVFFLQKLVRIFYYLRGRPCQGPTE
jgi:hypothetical protein